MLETTWPKVLLEAYADNWIAQVLLKNGGTQGKLRHVTWVLNERSRWACGPSPDLCRDGKGCVLARNEEGCPQARSTQLLLPKEPTLVSGKGWSFETFVHSHRALGIHLDGFYTRPSAVSWVLCHLDNRGSFFQDGILCFDKKDGLGHEGGNSGSLPGVQNMRSTNSHFVRSGFPIYREFLESVLQVVRN